MLGLDKHDARLIAGVLLVAAGFFMSFGLAATLFWVGGCVLVAGLLGALYGLRN
jgi:hypothetical protein